MKTYGEAKLQISEALRERFPEVDNGEMSAAVTHWLQLPHEDSPLLTKEIRDFCLSQLLPTKKRRIKNGFLAEDKTEYQTRLPIDWAEVPFTSAPDSKFRFIDLFAGIGGFRLAMQELGGKCVFSSEWDVNAKKTYEENFGEVPFGDIRLIAAESIPNHEILCAGFPCQPFSLAGVSARNALNTMHGFACETQGTLFFDIVRIIQAKRPKVAFLENVRNLVGHDGGKTFAVIKKTIESLGYSFSYKLIDASPLVPQRRVRCYMVCIRDDNDGFVFPSISGPPLPLRSILDANVDDSFTISSKLWEGHQRRTDRNLARGTGFTAFCASLDKPANTLVARYGKDGKECLIPQEGKNPRMLTPRECARLQGFPEEFIIRQGKTTAYKQFGNSVALPVIREIALSILKKVLPDKIDHEIRSHSQSQVFRQRWSVFASH